MNQNQGQAPPNGQPPPPPPPPHGDNPKTTSSGLPPGNYDIFIIPPESAGGGFIYFPSLRPHTHSFAAGVVSTLLVVYAWVLFQPVVKAWVLSVSQSGSGFGMLVLVLVVGFVGWIWGRAELPSAGGPASPKSNGSPPQNGHARGTGTNAGQGPQWNGGPHPQAGSGPGFTAGQHGQQNSQGNKTHANYGQGQQYQSPPSPPSPFEDTPPDTPTPDPPKEQPKSKASASASASTSAWEKAREETRKREEERKRQEEAKRKEEEEKRKKEDAERAARAEEKMKQWERERAREKEARERESREKQARERMQKDKVDADAKKAKEDSDRDARLAAAKERAEKLRAERAASEKAASERAKSEKAVPTFGVGERTNLYSLASAPNAPKSTIGVGAASRKPDPLANKPYHHPTAQSYAGTATDTAFRPYDKPKASRENASQSSASSYAPTESTTPTSPSRSHAGPYSTDDPNKVMITGAFKFNDSFANSPIASVRPGDGSITDGLIMRMTTEGVFLDDDRRGEGLRQWDIKAWTLTSLETINKAQYYLIRASIRSVDNVKHVYVVPASEQWKVATGLKTLKGGSLLRSTCSISTMSANDANKIMGMIGAF